MTFGLGISGIGYPLGTLGLGASGAYGSYDNYMPSMMGMNSMLGVDTTGCCTNPMMNPMLNPMMSMYNPLYYTQMQGAAEQIQAQHAGNMHHIMTKNEVSAQRDVDSALIEKMLTNSDVQQGIENLYQAVKEGKQDDICRKFDDLKTYIYHTYQDELKARGDKNNPAVSATKIINALYGNIVTAKTGETTDLRNDIVRYGEGSIMNGFMNGFRVGHGERYVDQTLSYCFGDEIEDKGSKDNQKTFAKGVGRTASVLEKGVIGAGTATAAGGLVFGLSKLLAPIFGKEASSVKFNSKAARVIITAGALAGMLGDIWWQISGSKNESSAHAAA